MAVGSGGPRRVRLSIDVDPELRRRVKIAAAERDLSVKSYLELVLRQALEADEQGTVEEEPGTWLTPPERSSEQAWGSGRDRRYWET